MAKVKLKTKSKTDETSIGDVDFDPADVAPSVEELGGVETSEEETVPEVSAPEIAAPAIIEIAPQVIDGVKITMLRELSPAPTVGKYNVGRELKVSKLDGGKSYRLPLDVAMVLVDSKAAVLTQ